MTMPSLPPEPAKVGAAATDPNEAIWQHFLSDPEGYLKNIITSVIQHEVNLMREEMQFRNALALARQRYPELAQLESYLLQELVGILEASPESDPSPSWDSLVDKGLQQLQGKFKSVVTPQTNSATSPMTQLMESGHVRQPQPEPMEFTRDQLAKMSMTEFLKYEDAINEALRQKRIR